MARIPAVLLSLYVMRQVSPQVFGELSFVRTGAVFLAASILAGTPLVLRRFTSELQENSATVYADYVRLLFWRVLAIGITLILVLLALATLTSLPATSVSYTLCTAIIFATTALVVFTFVGEMLSASSDYKGYAFITLLTSLTQFGILAASFFILGEGFLIKGYVLGALLALLAVVCFLYVYRATVFAILFLRPSAAATSDSSDFVQLNSVHRTSFVASCGVPVSFLVLNAVYLDKFEMSDLAQFLAAFMIVQLIILGQNACNRYVSNRYFSAHNSLPENTNALLTICIPLLVLVPAVCLTEPIKLLVGSYYATSEFEFHFIVYSAAQALVAYREGLGRLLAKNNLVHFSVISNWIWITSTLALVALSESSLSRSLAPFFGNFFSTIILLMIIKIKHGLSDLFIPGFLFLCLAIGAIFAIKIL